MKKSDLLELLTYGVYVEIISEDEYGGVHHVEPACALHADREAGG